ncbi:hypothetical protein [Rhodococcus qingshengii]|uniref:hypothetical protein n=1 Tax=Rhodococcus qingshengii TaxID=334542 RepID=UPI0030190479
MSNTPTESEFDKELDRALTNHRIWAYGVLSERNDKTLTQEEFVRENAKYQSQGIKAIKQEVDKQVDQLQTYKFTTGSEDKMVMLDDVKALYLYGGDKK